MICVWLHLTSSFHLLRSSFFLQFLSPIHPIVKITSLDSSTSASNRRNPFSSFFQTGCIPRTTTKPRLVHSPMPQQEEEEAEEEEGEEGEVEEGEDSHLHLRVDPGLSSSSSVQLSDINTPHQRAEDRRRVESAQRPSPASGTVPLLSTRLPLSRGLRRRDRSQSRQ